MKRIYMIALAALILGRTLAPLQAQAVKASAEAKEKELRTETIRLSYSIPIDVRMLLDPYLSKDGTIAIDKLGGVFLTIRDHPEFVEKILAAIKQIDVKPVDFLFTAQLVVGSSALGDKSDESLQNDPLIKELKNLLTYKSFTALDSNFIRTIDGGEAELIMGKADELRLQLRPRFTKDGTEDVIRLEIQLDRLVNPRTLIATQLSIKSGEKTVVGVSKLDGGDKGLILILSGKVIK